MHCARHTFGTCAMDLGISLEVISEIMGHTDTKTTRIYAKIREGLKNSEMEKWN
jgi:site-specific recombinase XerD